MAKRLDGSKRSLAWRIGGSPRPQQHCALAPPKKGHSPQFSAHVCYCQMAGWINMPVGTELGIGPGDIVFDGNLAPPKRCTPAPHFSVCVLWTNVWMDQDVAWCGGRVSGLVHTYLAELSKSFTGALRHQLSTSHVPYLKAQGSVRVCLSCTRRTWKTTSRNMASVSTRLQTTRSYMSIVVATK